MKIDELTNPIAIFPSLVSVALTRLKQRLQQDYERAYPDLREIMAIFNVDDGWTRIFNPLKIHENGT